MGLAAWTPELQGMRREVNRLRRRKQRAYEKSPVLVQKRTDAYKEACKNLHFAIVRAKYRIAMAHMRAKAPQPNLSADMAERMLRRLFPRPDDKALRQ